MKYKGNSKYWKKVWVKALRSKKYRKCSGNLMQPSTADPLKAEVACAIGVLYCEINRTLKKNKQPPLKSRRPEDIMSYAGLKLLKDEYGVEYPKPRSYGQTGEDIIWLNDWFGYSFKKMSGFLEKSLK